MILRVNALHLQMHEHPRSRQRHRQRILAMTTLQSNANTKITKTFIFLNFILKKLFFSEFDLTLQQQRLEL